MSSTENMISEIELDYQSIIKSFEGYVNVKDEYYKFNVISEDELLEYIRRIMKFQRTIENTLTLATNIEVSNNSQRLKTITKNIINILYSGQEHNSVSFSRPYSYSFDKYAVRGVLHHLKDAHNYLLHNEYGNSRRACYLAYFGFKILRPLLIEMEEELRQISALIVYPIDKKLQLNDQLITDNFKEVVVSLEEAESNVVESHNRDCVSRCRDAVEVFVWLLKQKETGKKTEKHFSTDLGTVVSLGICDDSVKRLVQGVYSFLSLKGSHKYDEKKVTVYDVEIALQQTYSLIELLLQKYSDYKKQPAQ
jgi:hypothetical protein